MTYNEFKQLVQEEIASCRSDAEKIDSGEKLATFKNDHLGKKSPMTALFSSMKSFSAEEKKELGSLLSKLKEEINSVYDAAKKSLDDKALEKKMLSEKEDLTLPASSFTRPGSVHPFDLVVEDVTDFFVGLGFEVASGPDVETDTNNFELLNIPKDHPSRDMQDSFSVTSDLVMRSHTSPVQARVMAAAKGQVPIKVICPGKVYRRDNDATHSHQFGQIEGLVISEETSMANLFELLTSLMKHLFGSERKVRFRPSYFPFTEPSIETDISCFECGGKGCSLCKHTGWIEILGAGMVHPNVLRLNGFDDTKYQGLAFGIGIDRVAMLKYGIDDIKKLYTDDVRFLEQFRRD